MTVTSPIDASANLEIGVPCGYNLIYADPPWTYKDKACSGRRGACFKYPVMTVDELCRLPVADLAAPDCLLAMWWTGALAPDALRVMSAWGFEFVQMKGFTWAKVNEVTGAAAVGMGNWTRANSEDVLFARRGNPKRQSKGVSQLLRRARRGHSEKPPEIAERLVTLMGDVPRIELFARDVKPGWHAWGLDVPGYPHIATGDGSLLSFPEKKVSKEKRTD